MVLPIFGAVVWKRIPAFPRKSDDKQFLGSTGNNWEQKCPRKGRPRKGQFFSNFWFSPNGEKTGDFLWPNVLLQSKLFEKKLVPGFDIAADWNAWGPRKGRVQKYVRFGTGKSHVNFLDCSNGTPDRGLLVDSSWNIRLSHRWRYESRLWDNGAGVLNLCRFSAKLRDMSSSYGKVRDSSLWTIGKLKGLNLTQNEAIHVVSGVVGVLSGEC